MARAKPKSALPRPAALRGNRGNMGNNVDARAGQHDRSKPGLKDATNNLTFKIPVESATVPKDYPTNPTTPKSGVNRKKSTGIQNDVMATQETEAIENDGTAPSDCAPRPEFGRNTGRRGAEGPSQPLHGTRSRGRAAGVPSSYDAVADAQLRQEHAKETGEGVARAKQGKGGQKVAFGSSAGREVGGRRRQREQPSSRVNAQMQGSTSLMLSEKRKRTVTKGPTGFVHAINDVSSPEPDMNRAGVESPEGAAVARKMAMLADEFDDCVKPMLEQENKKQKTFRHQIGKQSFYKQVKEVIKHAHGTPPKTDKHVEVVPWVSTPPDSDANVSPCEGLLPQVMEAVRRQAQERASESLDTNEGKTCLPPMHDNVHAIAYDLNTSTHHEDATIADLRGKLQQQQDHYECLQSELDSKLRSKQADLSKAEAQIAKMRAKAVHMHKKPGQHGREVEAVKERVKRFGKQLQALLQDFSPLQELVEQLNA